MLTHLFDIILPRHCACCGNRLMPTEDGVCLTCRTDFPLTYYWEAPEENPLAHLFHGTVRLKRAAAWFFYDSRSTYKHAVTQFKYGNDRALGQALTQWACSTLVPAGFFEGIDVIVPLPLTSSRQHHRGFNQCDIIAEEISRQTGIPVEKNAMRRLTFNKSQASQSKITRKENVEGVFQLKDARRICGQNVLIIDDVLTTGATLREFAMEVAKANVASITVFVLARAK